MIVDIQTRTRTHTTLSYSYCLRVALCLQSYNLYAPDTRLTNTHYADQFR